MHSLLVVIRRYLQLMLYVCTIVVVTVRISLFSVSSRAEGVSRNGESL